MPRPVPDGLRWWSLAERSGLAALLIVVGVVSATGLAAGYVFDDVIDVARNPAATPEGFAGALPTTVRPLLKASYAATAAVLGSGAPAQRAVNILLHLVATALVYCVLRQLLPPAAAAAHRWTPLLGAAIWALHPAAVETVTYVSGRSMGLSSVLVLAAFALATGDAVPSRPARRLASAALAFLAPLARETALVLPALVMLWQLTVGAQEPLRQMTRRQWPVWAGTVAAALVLALMPRHRALVEFSLRARDPWDALLGNVHAIPAMLSLWALPWQISIDPGAPEAYGWTEPATLWRLAALGAAIVFVLACRRRAPLAVFAVGWTLLAVVPTNSLIWRIDPVGTRPLYLASVGLALAVAGVLVLGVWVHHHALAAATVAGIGVLIGALGWATAARAALYQSPLALWEDAARKAPDKARPRANLGLLHLQAGRLDAAERELALAIHLEPWDREAACALEAVRMQRLSEKGVDP